MKLTPEQKAHRDYGKALGRLEKFREDNKNRLGQFSLYMRHYWRKHSKVCKKEVVLEHANLVREAWLKRAACRGWIHHHDRICGNCKFWDCLVDEHPCSDCNSHRHNKWKPREKNKKNTLTL